MTFKHTQHWDSEVFRSLEKVAFQKGMIKPEAIQKRAALTKKADLTPTNSLMENIFKLCTGMREQGLQKEAAEVEFNYFRYKQAQTLYETHKEKGEDLIQAAHPKGSHKLEGVDSEEATFEDILDRHVKILQKVEKRPTGKLSDATSILQAVKVVLGQDRKAQLENTIIDCVDKIKDKMSKVLQESNVIGIGPIERMFDSATTNAMEPGKLSDLSKVIDIIEQRIKPGVFTSGVTEDTWEMVSGLIGDSKTLIRDALKARREYNSIVSGQYSQTGGSIPTTTTSPVPTTPAGNATTQLLPLFNQIVQDLTSSKVKAQSLPQASLLLPWFDKALDKVQKVYQNGVANPADVATYISNLNAIKAKLDAGKKKWNL